MRLTIACAALCTLVQAVACSGSTITPVQPYSEQEPAASSSGSAQPSAPPPAAKPAARSVDDKQTDCEKISVVINANGEAFKDGLAKATDPKGAKGALSELATTVQQAGDKVSGLELKSNKLKSWAQEYQGLMVELARQLNQMEADSRKKDKAALKKDIAEIGKIESSEANLSERINNYCSP